MLKSMLVSKLEVHSIPLVKCKPCFPTPAALIQVIWGTELQARAAPGNGDNWSQSCVPSDVIGSTCHRNTVNEKMHVLQD